MIVAEFCLVFGICIVELIVCFVMFMFWMLEDLAWFLMVGLVDNSVACIL